MVRAKTSGGWRRVGSRAVAGALVLLLAAGCRNPLATYEDEYGVKMNEHRLRRVENLELPRSADQSAHSSGLDRFDGIDRVGLTLAQCRAAALENNLDLRVALLDPTIAAQSVTEEEAAFEASFNISGFASDTDTPTSSSLDSAQQRFYSVSPELQVPLRTGGTTTIRLPASRTRTDNAFTTLNPAYTSDLEFSISQPLLRGAGRRTNTHRLRVAALNAQISESATKLETIRQVAAVDRAYWRLYAARADLDVRLANYELAEAQLEQAQRRFEAGSVGEIEVVRAEAGLSDRLDLIIRANSTLSERQRELKRLINAPGLDVQSDTLIGVESEPDPVAYDYDEDLLVEQALARRMEMLELELRLAQDMSEIAFARNQALPLLSVDYTYRINGLGEDFGNSFDTLADNDFEDWSLGLTASIPIGNEAAKSRVRQALLNRLRRLRTKDAREQQIRKEVLDATENIGAGWQRILAARQSVILNTRAYQAEERQFEIGRSTSTDVLDAAARLTLARSEEIAAVTDYQIAQIDLAFATGTLLGSARVQWDPGEPLNSIEPGAWLEADGGSAESLGPGVSPAERSSQASEAVVPGAL